MNINFAAPHIPNEAPAESILEFSYIENETRKLHAGMVYEMDKAIGEIITALTDKNVLENTIIFFASDNGGLTPDLTLNPGFLNIPKRIGICNTESKLGIDLFEWICENFDGGSSNHPLTEGKMSVSEGGIRVPAALWWPGKFENSRSTNFISMMDMLPTILDLINYDGELNIDGKSQIRSLTNIVNNDSSKYVVTNIMNDEYAVIDMPYKLITSSDGYVLYNILKDPRETINIASKKPNVVSELQALLSTWPVGKNRSLPISEVLKDPDLFGGDEDRIPWVEKAFENQSSQ